MSRRDFCDTERLRFVCPRCARGTDASEALPCFPNDFEGRMDLRDVLFSRAKTHKWHLLSFEVHFSSCQDFRLCMGPEGVTRCATDGVCRVSPSLAVHMRELLNARGLRRLLLDQWRIQPSDRLHDRDPVSSCFLPVHPAESTSTGTLIFSFLFFRVAQWPTMFWEATNVYHQKNVNF